MQKISVLGLVSLLLSLYSFAASAQKCRDYDGQYVAYYGDVYFIKSCKRHALAREQIFELTKKKTKIHVAESDLIASTKPGAPYKIVSTFRDCKDLEGSYITFAYSDVYFVERCRKRLLPDWETLESHMRATLRGEKQAAYSEKTRNSQGGLQKMPEIISLTWKEFSAVSEGVGIPSVIDSEYEEAMQKLRENKVDILSQGEACEGVNGQFVAYYSRVYKIENCFKRLVDGPLFSSMMANKKVLEISSQKWISLPSGRPLELDTSAPKR